ncbi:MAG: hypothetical protein HeimC2_29290 [Candidatus Heimdallarchaeota archaeon LC_2]|nr:MAG: hypothetical protein HeimC2_29290 [Candidatus Heimdallarchaeota archaeon LC_2]
MSDNSSQVTSKGQVTIPVKLRRKFKLERGKKVVFVATEDGILIKPAFSELRKLRGILKETNLNEIMEQTIDELRREWRIEGD